MDDNVIRLLQHVKGVQGIVMSTAQGEVLKGTVGGAADRVAGFTCMLKEVADEVGEKGSVGQWQQGVLTVDDTRLLVLASGERLTGLLLDPDTSPLLAGKSAARILAGAD
jgi:predicted regulator of Ras-like GTPase activity (Roadblock/LC7/MglB family)